MILAIEGVDGSGKTTQAHALVARLQQAGFTASYTRPLFIFIKENSRRISMGPRRAGAVEPNILKTTALGVLGYFYAMACYLYLRFQPDKRKIIVCDRYFFQFFFDLFGGFGLRVTGLFPRPDMTFLLTGEPGAFYPRMTSPSDAAVNTEYFKKIGLLYNKLSEKYHPVKINGSMDKEKINDIIFEHVMKKMRKETAKIDPLHLVLAVVDPEYGSGVNISAIKNNQRLLQSAINTADRNGLYYSFMSLLRKLYPDFPFKDEKRWQEENRRLEELKGTVRLLNRISRDYGVEYIWIKSCNPIPHVPRDVDIFIHETDKARLTDALAKEGLIRDQVSKVQVLLEKQGLLRVDIYNAIRYFTKIFLREDFLFSSVIKDEMLGVEYPNLNKEANFLLSLIHSLFGHRSMSLLDFLFMKNLQNQIDLSICEAEAKQLGWGNVLRLFLQELDDINRRIKEGRMRFPYIFRTKFVLDCASQIKELELDGREKLAFSISIWLDSIRASQKDTCLYKLLRSFGLTRRLLNRTITIFRVMRGDETA
jgi:dTMP kinase